MVSASTGQLSTPLMDAEAAVQEAEAVLPERQTRNEICVSGFSWHDNKLEGDYKPPDGYEGFAEYECTKPSSVTRMFLYSTSATYPKKTHGLVFGDGSAQRQQTTRTTSKFASCESGEEPLGMAPTQG